MNAQKVHNYFAINKMLKYEKCVYKANIVLEKFISLLMQCYKCTHVERQNITHEYIVRKDFWNPLK